MIAARKNEPGRSGVAILRRHRHRNRHRNRHPMSRAIRCRAMQIGSTRANMTRMTVVTQAPGRRGTPTAIDEELGAEHRELP
jgi:hypothetical protein